MANRLPRFEGQDVIRSAVKITKAGDGLSDALRLDPSPMAMDEDVYFVLRGKVRAIDHKPTGPADDTLQRIHIVVTEEITRVDEEVADPILRDAAAVLAEKRAKEVGQDPLPGSEHGAPGLATTNGTEAGDEGATVSSIGDAPKKAAGARKRASKRASKPVTE